MTVLTPTKAAGASSRPLPGLYVEPMQQITVDDLESFVADAHVNGPFVADLLSAVLAHEQRGRHLYRICAARTRSPMLHATYEHFGAETEEHVRIVQDLIESCGGDPHYVSPSARVVHAMDSALVQAIAAVGGGVDASTVEMAMLDAVFVAETIDHANWSTLAQLTGRLPAGPTRDRFADAVGRVEAQEDEHVQWAQETRQRLVMLQAEHESATVTAATDDEAAATIRGWFDGD